MAWYQQTFNPSAGAAFSVTMPPAPVDGDLWRMKYIGPYAGTYPITLLPNTGQSIDNGSVPSVPLVGSNASLDLSWNLELASWMIS